MEKIKYYSVIPSARYPELKNPYAIITMLTDEVGNLTGETLLEGYHTPEQLSEVEALGGTNYTYEGYLNRQ